MSKDFMQRLAWLEEELRSEEAEEETEEELEETDEFEDELANIKQILEPGYNYAADFHRAVYEDESDYAADYAPPVKKKGIKGLVFLAFLEILGILAIIGWWMQWLL